VCLFASRARQSRASRRPWAREATVTLRDGRTVVAKVIASSPPDLAGTSAPSPSLALAGAGGPRPPLRNGPPPPPRAAVKRCFASFASVRRFRNDPLSGDRTSVVLPRRPRLPPKNRGVHDRASTSEAILPVARMCLEPRRPAPSHRYSGRTACSPSTYTSFSATAEESSRRTSSVSANFR
jgi:hypothetical protein